jgi:hypothetical protein
VAALQRLDFGSVNYELIAQLVRVVSTSTRRLGTSLLHPDLSHNSSSNPTPNPNPDPNPNPNPNPDPDPNPDPNPNPDPKPNPDPYVWTLPPNPRPGRVAARIAFQGRTHAARQHAHPRTRR